MDRYATENLVFFDFESRCAVPIKWGAYRYAIEADPILLSYAIGKGPIQRIDLRGAALTYGHLPADLCAAFDAGKVFCAFNTGFDRAIWNFALAGSPWMAPDRVIDARATALAHNLPDDLEALSKRLGGPGKQKDGKPLIALFCGVNAVMPDTPELIEKWNRFGTYADRDVEELRRCFGVMLPALTDYDWQAYQANEVVNDNGAGVDLAFCREAARLSQLEAARIGVRLGELTDGKINSINQNLRLAEWVHDRLPFTEAREIMATTFKEEADAEDDDTLVEKTKLTIGRGTVERLIDFLKSKDCSDAALMEVLELREFGASAAPKKFQAILDQHVDGRLYGQFTFNGAGQTGRFSGRGVQLQNLTRTTLGEGANDDYGYWEEPTVALISDGCSLEELLAHGAGECAARKLALTIRPAFCATAGRTLVKGDYSQIEARVLPWLSKSAGGEKLLESFRASDADPDAPDLYRVTAGGMMGIDPRLVAKEARQRGKVAVLACGYGGGRNALHSMGANYRMVFTDEEAQKIVDAWRASNPWAPAFWGKHTKDGSYGLFGAARRAIQTPLTQIAVGRVSFVYIPLRRDGTLLCILPSGRPLVYPSCRMRDYDIVDKKTKKVLDTRHGLTFRRARGIIALYGGRFAENVTQAAAADLLREAIVRLVAGGHCVVSHSHDEIVVECDVRDIAKTERAMQAAMTFDRGWADGLPLAIDMTERWYYSAAKKKEEETWIPELKEIATAAE
jgi:DNA polymerase bacteriophage-type